MKFFNGRKLIIATKHQKERVILPLVKANMHVDVFVPTDYDTDKFGTFSGEITRTSNALETVRKKCLDAMNHYGYDLGIASEGSFGPHPSLFFAQADDELLILIDQKNNLEIIARAVSLETNFSGEKIQSYEQLIEFAKQVHFPSHGLLLKDGENQFSKIHKDILDWEQLKLSYDSLTEHSKEIWAETDMRAHRNPTRMQIIEQATQKLIKKVASLCPNCQTPGYDVREVVKGLPCNWCKSPTSSTLALRYACQKCSHTTLEEYPNGKHYESPEFCSNCNP
ncbi:DUF6671 family protein [Flavobacterium sp.]|uniref:DUF6671 family protein n=1 Tax=Flavobacterium sp. TaxID=239 RepID=UPI0035292EBD